MNDLLMLGLALAGGMLLGLFFFGGLWLTVRRIPGSRSPVLFTIGSFIARTAVVMVGFYFITQGHWARVAVALLGFLVMRAILIHRFRPIRETSR